jgi:Ca-activated chloride channel family protein
MKRKMNKQDKLFERIRQAAESQEQQAFQRKEAVWEKVSQKLNPKKRKRMILYRSLGAAAVLAIIIFAGFQFSGDQNPSQQNVTNKQEEYINKDIQLNDSTKTELVESHKEALKEAKKLNFTNPDTLESIEQPTDQPGTEAIVALEADAAADTVEDQTTPDQQNLNSIENERGKQVAVLETISDDPASDKVSSVSILEERARRLNQKEQDNHLQHKNNQNMIASNTVQNAESENSIQGTVVDAEGLPVPGVNVMVKGTSKGTQTDFDGLFSIEVEIGETLVFNYVGFETHEVEIINRKDLMVTLETNTNALDEVVVTSYRGILKESEVVSASSNVETKTIAQVPVASIEQVLEGSVTGAQIRQGKGQPGQTQTVIIRGVSSINKSEEPLFIVDGIPLDQDKFRKIESKDIESLKVLKDASANAIYGNRGSNGVILITTKNATKQQKQYSDSINNLYQIFKKQSVNNEDYETFKENPFTSPLSEPLSTFSIDVDRAAYTNIRRMINNGQEVPKDAVRIEEMLNFFEYDYDKPKDKHPFAIHTAYSDAPWNKNHKLLRIALQGKDIPVEELPASNLVFLIDVSGSMSSQNKLPLVKKSLNLLVDQMRSKDKIALVTYAGNSQVVLEPTSGKEKTKIKNAINRLSTGGGTYASQGIETAYSLAEENFVEEGNNRVIIATDGDFNIGVTQNNSLEELIAKKRKTNIFLTCLGYGMGNYKDSKMQSLSQKGNGNYAYIDTYQEAQKFLEREFKGSLYAIAKDVKIQIEFNPKHVDSYRLIGYETRMLEDRDFADDTKDAGEIGVNHQVTALYEVIPRGVESQFGEFNPNLKYQKVEQPDFNLYSDELATVKFRYKHPRADKSIKLERIIKNQSMALNKTSADFKFATAVAWFGLKLRDSQMISNTDKEAIIELAEQGLENDKEGYRAEFIRLVRLHE